MAGIYYEPVPSLAPLYYSEAFWNFVIGPLGSTKTYSFIFWLLSKACTQNAYPDAKGVMKRQTRYVISRNTLRQIYTSIHLDIMNVLAPVAIHKASEHKIDIRLTLPDETIVESEWFYIPLDTADDQRRLLSMQLSGVLFNEIREIRWDLVNAAAGRVPRFPPRRPNDPNSGCTFPFVAGDTNPPAEGSDMHTFLMGPEPTGGLCYLHQPGALTTAENPDPRWGKYPYLSAPYADWLHWHDPLYYERLTQGVSRTWIDVHVHSKFGPDPSGLAVFHASFNEEIHVKDKIRVIPGAPLICGLDVGFNPACVMAQLSDEGQLRVVGEAIGTGMLLNKFVMDVLRSLFYQPRFMGCSPIFIVDPASGQRFAGTGESTMDILLKLQLNAIAAMSNALEPRLQAVERMLVEMVGGMPRVIIDQQACPILIGALASQYRYKKSRDGGLAATPEKKHPVSDIADAFQYLCLGLSSQFSMRSIERVTTGYPRRQNRAPSPKAWT